MIHTSCWADESLGLSREDDLDLPEETFLLFFSKLGVLLSLLLADEGRSLSVASDETLCLSEASHDLLCLSLTSDDLLCLSLTSDDLLCLSLTSEDRLGLSNWSPDFLGLFDKFGDFDWLSWDDLGDDLALGDLGDLWLGDFDLCGLGEYPMLLESDFLCGEGRWMIICGGSRDSSFGLWDLESDWWDTREADDLCDSPVPSNSSWMGARSGPRLSGSRFSSTITMGLACILCFSTSLLYTQNTN